LRGRKKSALSSRTLTHFHPVKDLTFAELFEGKKSSQSRISYTKRYLIIYVIMLSFFPQVKIGRIRTGLAEAPLLPDLRSVVLLIIVLQSKAKAIFRRNTSCLSPPLNSLTTGILCIVVLTIAAQKSSPTSSPYQSSPLSGPCTRKRKTLRTLPFRHKP